jgi:hypothetical protein
MREVVIDADFFNHMTCVDTQGELFCKIMGVMEVSPVLHEYVQKQELFANSVMKLLVDGGNIKVYCYDDFLNTKEEREKYEKDFYWGYQKLNYEHLPKDVDVFTYRKAHANMGELHSALLAKKLGIGLMMSDDRGARDFVEHKLNSRKNKIMVYNSYDVVLYIAKQGESVITWKDIKSTLKKCMSDRCYEEVKMKWHD